MSPEPIFFQVSLVFRFQPVRLLLPRAQRALPGDGIREGLGRQTRFLDGAARIRDRGPRIRTSRFASDAGKKAGDGAIHGHPDSRKLPLPRPQQYAGLSNSFPQLTFSL